MLGPTPPRARARTVDRVVTLGRVLAGASLLVLDGLFGIGSVDLLLELDGPSALDVDTHGLRLRTRTAASAGAASTRAPDAAAGPLATTTPFLSACASTAHRTNAVCPLARRSET